jgi:hypothetical protein
MYSTLLEKICLPPAIVFTGSESDSYCRWKICSPLLISDLKMRIVIFDRFLRHSCNSPLLPIGTHNIDKVFDELLEGFMATLDSICLVCSLYFSSLIPLPSLPLNQLIISIN